MLWAKGVGALPNSFEIPSPPFRLLRGYSGLSSTPTHQAPTDTTGTFVSVPASRPIETPEGRASRHAAIREAVDTLLADHPITPPPTPGSSASKDKTGGANTGTAPTTTTGKGDVTPSPPYDENAEHFVVRTGYWPGVYGNLYVVDFFSLSRSEVIPF